MENVLDLRRRVEFAGHRRKWAPGRTTPFVWQDGRVSVVTIFRSRLREGVDDDYDEVASTMSRLVRTIDGFIDEQFYRSAQGERVTIVRFRDADSQRAWARHPEHLVAQQRGRDEFYAWYDIAVCDETYTREFNGEG